MATDTPMQLGMVGLGRMGAGIVRRLLEDGHRCVGYDIHPDAVEARRRGRRRRRLVARGARGEARAAAGGVGDGSRRGDHEHDDRGRRRRARARRRRDRRRQHLLPRRPPARGRAPGEGHPPPRRRYERRRLGPPARVLPDDRRRDRGRSHGSSRSSARSRRASTPRRGRPGARASRAWPSTATTTAARTAQATS